MNEVEKIKEVIYQLSIMGAISVHTNELEELVKEVLEKLR